MSKINKGPGITCEKEIRAIQLMGRGVDIEKLTAERDNALAQNAELVAKIERLMNAIIGYQSKMIHAVQSEEEISANTNLAAAIIATPTQHLRDRDAEVGRAGFVAGYEKCWRESYGTKPNTDSVDEYADSYAERVKAGSL